MKIETKSSEEFFEVTKREKLGEIIIRSLTSGKENGYWIFEFDEVLEKQQPKENQ